MTDESMYGALTRVVQPDLVAGNARQLHHSDMPDEFV
jgi:hypothetical protein